MRIKQIITIVLTLSISFSSLMAFEPQVSAQTEPIKIGVLQHLSHPALDDSRDGFIEQMNNLLGEDNIEWDLQNANGNMSALQSISEKLARDNDLLYAIATPAAQSLAAVEQDKPIVFAAVTGPVEAQLVDTLEEPGRNVTGVTNLAPVADHVDLLLDIFPKAKTVGTIYNPSEINAQIQVDLAAEALQAKGLNHEVTTITSTNEIAQAMTALVNKVDVILLVNDSTVDSSIALVGDIAKEAGIALIGSSDSTIKANGLATISNSYVDYGRQAADMAKRLIDDSSLTPAKMAVEKGKNFELVVNAKVADELGIDIGTIKPD